MSGIVGLYRRDGGPVGDDLERMLAALAHCGPDGVDAWVDGPVGLGHLRLRTDPTTPAGIATNGDASALTADARIDNRAALAASLDPAGPDDGSLLAAACDRWAAATPTHLLGAFAFAAWDRERERLVCARDHLGVKPLYYHASDALVAVATEPKAILALDAVDPTIDPEWVVDYLVTHADHRRTVHREIRRLPPAHTLVVDPDGITCQRYWQLEAGPALDLPSDAAYERRFRELLETAVDCRLPTDRPAGAMLSGGLDSSAVACVARDVLATRDAGPLSTLSFAYPSVPASDERSYIDAVLAQPGFAPTMLPGDRIDPLDDAARRQYHLDGPLFSPNAALFWRAYAALHQRDVGVVLDGFGGDEVVSHGLTFLPALLLGGRWRRLARELRAVTTAHDGSLPAVVRRRLLGPLVPTPVRRVLSTRGDPVQARNPTVDPAVAARTDIADRLRSTEASAWTSTPRERHRDALCRPVIATLFEAQDAQAAAWGIEPRYPYYDRRLIRFCLRLPFDQRLRDGRSRSIVRRALADTLPERVAARPGKTYLGAGFRAAFASHAGDRIDRLGRTPDATLTRYVDPDALRSACEAVLTDPSTGDVEAVWRALALDRYFHSTENV